jgi:hypothetical protein
MQNILHLIQARNKLAKSQRVPSKSKLYLVRIDFSLQLNKKADILATNNLNDHVSIIIVLCHTFRSIQDEKTLDNFGLVSK